MKRNVYEQEDENMEEMTDESLAEMVSKKHAGNTDTDIICNHFLEALENNKYGRTVLQIMAGNGEGRWKTVKKREERNSQEET